LHYPKVDSLIFPKKQGTTQLNIIWEVRTQVVQCWNDDILKVSLDFCIDEGVAKSWLVSWYASFM